VDGERYVAVELLVTLALLLAIIAVAAPHDAVGVGTQAAPGVLWRFTTGGRPLLGTAAAGPDGTLYAAAGDGVLYAVAPNGRARWSLPSGVTSASVATGSPATRPAVAADGTSYWSLQGAVVAVDPIGHTRWVFLGGVGSAPVLSRGRVLVVAGPYLYAIAASGPTAGRRLWRAAIGAGASVGGPAPAMGSDGTAYVAASDGYLYAIAPNGLRRWAFHVGAPLLFSPAVGLDGMVYLSVFAAGRGTLYALTPDGRPRWRLTIPVGGDVVRGPDGTLYVAAHLLLAVSPRGRVLWRRTVDAAAPVTVAGPLVIVPALSPPALLAFDAAGAPRWRLPLPVAAVGAVAAGPANRLYSGDYLGTLTALVPGAHGAGRLIQGAARATPAVDLAASNPPFVARRGALSWRVTLAAAIERGINGARWRTVFSPGLSPPDARTGRYRNARYAGVTFLATDPHTPAALYVGTTGAVGDYLSGGRGGADGGLYYSLNGTTGWRRLTTGLPFTLEPRLHVPAYGLDSLVFDPARRGVLYVQTPPSYGSPGHDAGLYKSIDGGAHWREATRGLRPDIQSNALLGAYRAYPPGPLLVDSARTTVLFLITPSGLYRSTDAAGRWEHVGAVRYDDPASLVVRPGPGAVVRVYTDRGLYRSGDFGGHWVVESRKSKVERGADK